VAIAVLRHRLFDIKVVIGRVLVYGAVTVVLLTVYVLIAVGLARAVPGTTDLGRLLAAAVVALAFAPLRSRLQGMVGRRLFGDRTKPYAALVRVSREAEQFRLGANRSCSVPQDEILYGLRLHPGRSRLLQFVVFLPGPVQNGRFEPLTQLGDR
jgi:hypothetical protein